MNAKIKALAEKCVVIKYDSTGISYEAGFDKEKFAELIVRMCADYADMAQDAGCEYAGDYVAEAMGFGEEEGVTVWRNGV